MDKLELQKKITQIGTCEDVSEMREQLTQLYEECEPDYDRLTELETSNTTLQQDNEKLRSANMKLFLRVGDSNKPAKEDPDDDPPKREFKNLFNEKGGIK